MLDQEIQLTLDEKQDEILSGMPVPQDGKIGDIRTNVFHKGKTFSMMKTGIDAWWYSAPFTRTPSIHTMDDYLLKSGGRMLDRSKIDAYDVTVRNNLALFGNVGMAKGKYIATDEIRARDSSGLKLYDDAGVIGSGVFLKDGGDFGVGVFPSYKFSIGSADGSDQIGIYHNNSNAFFKTTDGVFVFLTDEGISTSTYIYVLGKGSGYGRIRAYDRDDQEYVEFLCRDNVGHLDAYGASPGALVLQYLGQNDVALFNESTEGITKELLVYGYKTGDSLRSLQIGVGVDAADTASFDGVSNYYFDGNAGFGLVGPKEKVAIAGNIALPKTSGNGIKVDNTTPTFGWRDLRAEIRTRGVGGTDPNDMTYIGNVKAYSFAVNDEAWIEFHIPHDYVAGTDIHLHFHWSHNSAIVTGGSITIGADVTYAKGHDQAAFAATVNPTLSPNASTTQYQHIVSELQLSASTPGATQIDTDDLEPDGLILARVYLSANNITSGGAVPDPFIHEVDLHYQSTNIATKDKVPDFYS